MAENPPEEVTPKVRIGLLKAVSKNPTYPPTPTTEREGTELVNPEAPALPIIHLPPVSILPTSFPKTEKPTPYPFSDPI
jgi:hypothetical protein